MGRSLTELYGSPNALYHERCDDDRHHRTGIGGKFRPPDGRIPLDLRIHESCSRNDCRQGKPQVADRRKPVRLVVRYADDGLLHYFQPNLFPPCPDGGKRSFIYPCRIIADHRLSPGKDPFAGRRYSHDRTLHRTGPGRFRCDSSKRLHLGNDLPLVWDCRNSIQRDPDPVPER